MLLTSIIIYLAVTVAVGIGASLLVRNTKDYLLAGRSLPLSVTTAALFATWFGSETVLGASSVMAKEGLGGVVEDPFGAALCLLLLGIFFARKLYKMNLLTFGDFYRERYGKGVEAVASIFLILSYLGWIAAQMVAIGIVLNVVTGMEVQTGILAGSCIVILYTSLGGMWAVSITDFVQMILIVIGLLLVLWQMNGVQPLGNIIEQTPRKLFSLLPENKNSSISWLNYFAAWITIGLGSLPQQDVFQRVMSAKNEKTAVRASYLGAGFYLTIAFIPLLLALYARVLHPDLLHGEEQLMLPALVMQYCSSGVQILFFGALLSAIMSTASGALLAPSSILSENIINHFFRKLPEKQLLWTSRLSVVGVAAVALVMALSKTNIYELVGESSALSLVSLFVPMVAGIYWKKANTLGAFLSLCLGMITWLITLYIDTAINPMLYGLAASILGMFIGVYAQKYFNEKSIVKF